MDDQPQFHASRTDSAPLRCSIPEAARRLGVTERTVRTWIKTGILVAEREGKRLRVLLPQEQPPEQAKTGSGEVNPENPAPNRQYQEAIPTPTGQQAMPTALEQVIARTSTKFVGDLNAISKEIGQLYAAQLAVQEKRAASPELGAAAADRGLLSARSDNQAAAQSDQAASTMASGAPTATGYAPTPPEAQAHAISLQEKHIPPLAPDGQARHDRSMRPHPYPRQLPARPQALLERVRRRQGGVTIISASRLGIILVLCALAVIIGLGIVMWNNARANVRSGAASGATTGSLIVSIPTATLARTLSTTTAPLSRTPLARAPRADGPALPTGPPTTVAARRPALDNSTARPTTQVPSSPTSSRSITPTIPLSSPAPPPPLDQASVGGAPVPSAHLPSPITVLQQVAAAEAALRTGQFEAAIDYGNQNRSSAHLRFDFGDDRRTPRLHIVSQYQSASGAQIVERITIGDQSWQREIDGRWTARPSAEGVWDQVVPFLPHAGSVSSAAIEDSGNPAVLRWYDAGRDADIILVVDLTSGIPLELRQTSRATGLVLSVNYRGWNTPVEITPPEES
jgi:excisionase family DNA binding protein